MGGFTKAGIVGYLYTRTLPVNWVIYFLEIYHWHWPSFMKLNVYYFCLTVSQSQTWSAITWVWEPQLSDVKTSQLGESFPVLNIPDVVECVVTWCGWFFPPFVLKSWIINFQVSREFKYPSIIPYSGNIYRIPDSRLNCILEWKRVQDY